MGTVAGRVICQHCGEPRSVLRQRRGLCRRCYHTPAIRNLYSQTGSLAGLAGQSTNDRDCYCPSPPLPEPTTAPPGPKKVDVLCQRASQRYSLWHPRDGHTEPSAIAERLVRMLGQDPVALAVDMDSPYHRHLTRFTDEIVAEVFAFRNEGLTFEEIGRRVGLASMSVWKLVSGRLRSEPVPTD